MEHYWIFTQRIARAAHKLFTDRKGNLLFFSKEIPYYLAKRNRYGVPLDCREDYTKSDWIMWIAAMAPDRETFDMLVDPVYDYVNESPRRFPLGDWYGTVDCMPIQFRARSVIAGHWMPVLMMKSR